MQHRIERYSVPIGDMLEIPTFQGQSLEVEFHGRPIEPLLWCGAGRQQQQANETDQSDPKRVKKEPLATAEALKQR